MNPRRLVVASKNPDKIAEVESALASLAPDISIVRGLDWPDVEETEATLEGNALLKARAVANATNILALADDTGLEVDALNGRPGVHSARYAGPDASYEANVAKLLQELEGRTDRTARFRTVVAIVEPGSGSTLVVEGRLEGRITAEARGEFGFGYDPVFEVDGQTLAEIPPAEKRSMSHRAKAVKAAVEALAKD